MRPLILALLLVSCSPDFYCRRCNLFGGIKKDTVFATKILVAPEKRADTLFVAQPGETVFVDRPKIHIRYATRRDSVYIGCNCDPDTIRVKVPVVVNKEIKTGVNRSRVYWLVASGALIALLVGIGLGIVAKKVRG